MEKLLEFFKPSHYSLKLDINKRTKKVKASASIEGEALKDIIKFHAKNLEITEVKVSGEPADYSYDGELLELKSNSKKTIIEIAYHFTLNTNMQGAYLSTYKHEGETHRLVSTQFESHYAREAFPCIDEPAAKATFDLEITTKDLNDTVISNMPVKNVVKNTTSKTVIFETTPKMSTYLLAFCIGEFKHKSKTSLHGIKVTTYCTLNHQESALDFANQIAVDSLDFYDDKFDTPYPLTKLDQIAIPDFEAGAMENWGLVTYRESCLLVDKNTSLSTKQYIATVIAHELSHQWFGNLVTMKWWDNLWLNESFATMMEYACVDAIRPEYNIWEDFLTGDCLAAFRRDALPGVQAVQQDVNDPAEIATLFDGAIVYAKGAHLMFMLYRLMGEKAFYHGLKSYFKKHKYANTTGDDLWLALQEYADFNVKDFMDVWISQPGYPVITDDSQQRFQLSGIPDDTKWPLPKITDDMSGHYLIALSGPEFDNTLKRFNELNLEQKLRLLIDRMLLAKTARVSAASLLDVVPYFKTESSFSVWEIVASIIGDLKLFFPYLDPDRPAFQNYVYGIISEKLDELGLNHQKSDTDNQIKLRELLISLAIYAEAPEILAELAERYDNDYAKIHPELRSAVLHAKVKLDESEVFEQMLDKYQATHDPEMRSDILAALATAKEHHDQLIKLLKSPKIVRPQDHLYLFAYLLRNPHTKNQAIDWIYQNWSYLEEMTGEKSIEDYPRILASVINTIPESKAFDEFFDPKSNNPVLKRTIEVAKNDIFARLRLIQMDSEDVHRHLENL